MNKTTLVIMAAGMGSRFGKGTKQLEHVGPSGEILMDYSIYDAIEAGFDKVVVIIRKDIEADFRRLIGDKISKTVDISYVYQEMDDIPEGCSVPAERTKPLGTGHAILCCKDMVDTPFAIINADDFYGREAYVKMHEYLANVDVNSNEYCMAGYVLGNTLSEHGTVTRGICRHNGDNKLTYVDESFELRREGDKVVGKNSKGQAIEAKLDDLVSMNMWGCTPTYFKILYDKFVTFLNSEEGDPLKKEYLLPLIMGELVIKGEASVEILPVAAKWFGLTYAEDKPIVVEKLKEMIAEGIYTDNLWNV